MVYKVLEETVTDEEQGQRLTYGIIAGAAVVSDISDKREAVERLVELLNTRQETVGHSTISTNAPTAAYILPRCTYCATRPPLKT